jgi:hypothetical protein
MFVDGGKKDIVVKGTGFEFGAEEDFGVKGFCLGKWSVERIKPKLPLRCEPDRELSVGDGSRAAPPLV